MKHSTSRSWIHRAFCAAFAAILSGCDGGTSVGGNLANNISENTPSTSLTFSTVAANEAVSTPGDSALLSALADSESATTFEELQILVFGPMCSGCHFGGGTDQPSLFDFTTADSTYATLVNQPSTVVPARTLVIPGNSTNSYLISTLLGTQAEGSRMPLRAKPVSDELMLELNNWIDSGANR